MAIYPQDKHALDGLGITYREMATSTGSVDEAQGHYQQAIDWFKKELAIYPKNKQAMDGLGITYREMATSTGSVDKAQGYYQQAIDWFKKKLDFYPNDEYALAGLKTTFQRIIKAGIACREKTDYEQAIIWFELVLEHEKNHHQAWSELQKTVDDMGHTPHAIGYLKKRLLRDAHDDYARSKLESITSLYEQEGKHQEALEIAKSLQEVQLYAKKASVKIETPDEKIARLEATVQRKEAELLQSRQLAAIGMMASGLAHEVMQPLQIILSTTQNCQEDIKQDLIDTDGILDDLEKIAKTTKRLAHVITHLRALSREADITIETVNLNDIVESSLMMFRQQLKSHGIMIEEQLAENLPSIQADEVQLEQILINLITNAREALSEQDDRLLTIATEQQNGLVQIQVVDNGPGIAPEKLSHVFEPFYSSKEKGVGLGLYISKDIAQDYGGTIFVDSTPNAGTKFTISFPIDKKE
ncbi:ATP-binding protein [Anaerolineales bacterium HSG6]|nr:ATP-binding protein [Anaerolineales bacterium HSG6]